MRQRLRTLQAVNGPQVDLGDGFWKRLRFWVRVKSSRRVCYMGHSAESASELLDTINEQRGIIGLIFVSKDGMIIIEGRIPTDWWF